MQPPRTIEGAHTPVLHGIGVVLAGGRSTRMGEDKAYLPPNEPEFDTLLARQAALLGALELDRVFVSLRKDMTPPGPTMEVLYDPAEDLGPLGGIVAAMRTAPSSHVVVLAVDLPLVDEAFLRSLIARSSETTGAIPSVSGRWEPLCGIYPPLALERAEAHLWGPGRSPTALVSELAADGAIREYQVPPAAWDRLKSWNRPEDFPGMIRPRANRHR